MEGASVGCVPIGGRTGQLLDDARTVSAEEDVALLVILKGGVVGQHLRADSKRLPVPVWHRIRRRTSSDQCRLHISEDDEFTDYR